MKISNERFQLKGPDSVSLNITKVVYLAIKHTDEFEYKVKKSNGGCRTRHAIKNITARALLYTRLCLKVFFLN